MTLNLINHPAVERFRDYLRGFVAMRARAAGWPPAQAVAMATKADEIATGHILAGEKPNDALAAAVSEADLIVTLDTFDRVLAACQGDADAAFGKVVELKMRGISDPQDSFELTRIARKEFAASIKQGLAPQAAFLCAYHSSRAYARFKSLHVTNKKAA